MAQPVLTVANQLTMLRMAMVPLLVLLALDRKFTWALVVFVVASLTDALDGYIARHGHQVTMLGSLLDPIADKLLVGSTFAVMTWSSAVSCPVPIWLTVPLLFRDVMLVVGVLLVSLTSGVKEFPPSFLGKLSTALNVAAGVGVFAVNALGECPPQVRWLYGASLAALVASTAQYVYVSSERPSAGA